MLLLALCLSVCLIELLLGSFYCVQHDTTSQSQVLLSETEGRVHIVRSCLSPPISCQQSCYSSLKGDDFPRHFRYRFSTYTLLRPATQNHHQWMKPLNWCLKYLVFKSCHLLTLRHLNHPFVSLPFTWNIKLLCVLAKLQLLFFCCLPGESWTKTRLMKSRAKAFWFFGLAKKKIYLICIRMGT